MNRRRYPLLTVAAAVVSVLVSLLFGSAPADAAASHALIQGSGSSWSANAVNQWIADVQANGLQVVFTASGSAIGRKDFAYRTTDFAVSDIGYQGKDPVTGEADTPCTPQCRPYAYLPIVAGGTAFPYQIKVAGQLVRNLRLSGQTLAKIFTNKITNWDDPEITADNNGHALPSLPIIPVVHSEGSGSTAQFTRYLDKQYPSIWRPFLGTSGLTEYFPRKGGQIAQNGSDGVMNFISSGAANGAIGYDEYSYALAKNFPVAKVENAAGYFTAPTQYNVAVALTKAQINMDKSSKDYLLQNLDQVYTNPDPRTYAISSYSYMIIPTSPTDPRMTTAKRQTLADFLYYSVCQGQAEMGPIGYSPLPINLVQASFAQTAKLKTADPGVDLTQRNVSTCHNPTFIAGQPNRNYLAEIAPKPPACDKSGAGPCDANAGIANGNPRNGKAPQTSSPGQGSTTSSGSTATKGSSTATSGGAKTAASSSTGTGQSGTTAVTGSTGASPSVNPDTGQVVDTQVAAAADPVTGVPTQLAGYRQQNLTSVLGSVAALEILALIVLPPILAVYLSRRRRRQS
ncbi:MAG TPA: substrate-binding domain-containing protein [Actinomycetes bacterium]|nr:substrate-binding domain-containing protein [Actinomycetes bacterium]